MHGAYKIILIPRSTLQVMHRIVHRYMYVAHAAHLAVNTNRHSIRMTFSHTDWGSMYPYTADLMALDFCRSRQPHAYPQLSEIATPLNPAAWEMALQAHPDRAYARYLVTGIRQGFRIGFDWQTKLQSATRNMQSAVEHPDIIRAYLQKELSLG